MTTRLPDWQERLGALLAERRAAAFAWGTNDCCTFAADCVQAITGEDVGVGLRGHRTAQDALSTLDRCQGVDGLASSRLGAQIAPALGQVGDIGLALLDGRDTLVVCVGMHWTAPGDAGLVHIAPERVTRAWRVTS